MRRLCKYSRPQQLTYTHFILDFVQNATMQGNIFPIFKRQSCLPQDVDNVHGFKKKPDKVMKNIYQRLARYEFSSSVSCGPLPIYCKTQGECICPLLTFSPRHLLLALLGRKCTTGLGQPFDRSTTPIFLEQLEEPLRYHMCFPSEGLMGSLLMLKPSI